jgi:predicted molibdopterin-dependent oxidoreductase YjgC
MDDLIIQIEEKTGLSRAKVIEVVTIVTDFMKERVPTDVIETVSEYLGDAGGKTVTIVGSATGMATDAARSAADIAADATSKAVGTASTVISTATGSVAGMIDPDDIES